MSTLAYRTLLSVLQGIPDDTIVWSDTWRVEADAAQLNTAERGYAPRHAAKEKYLEPFVIEVDGVRILGCVASEREHGKGGRVLVYRRTGKPIPDHLCKVPAPGTSMPSVSIENGQDLSA